MSDISFLRICIFSFFFLHWILNFDDVCSVQVLEAFREAEMQMKDMEGQLEQSKGKWMSVQAYYFVLAVAARLTE